MILLKLANLLLQLVDALKEALRQKRVKDFKDAKDKALADRDQRPIEENLGGVAGPSNPSKYSGMFTRAKKKASKD